MAKWIVGSHAAWSTRIASLIGSILLTASPAVLAVRISAALPAGAPTQFVIQPGESTTFSIDFTNLDDQAGQGIGRGRHLLPGVNTSLTASWVLEPIDLISCGYPM